MQGLILFLSFTVIVWYALQNQIEEGDTHSYQPETADDLTKIEGIGPKISQLLSADGISSYDALAKATVKKIEEILEMGGSKFNAAEPDSWPKQAQMAAKGDWDALQKLQDELTGGR